MKISRRGLLLGAFLSACGRKLAKRSQAWLYVASGSERCVAIADLAEFRRMSEIRFPMRPTSCLLPKRAFTPPAAKGRRYSKSTRRRHG